MHHFIVLLLIVLNAGPGASVRQDAARKSPGVPEHRQPGGVVRVSQRLLDDLLSRDVSFQQAVNETVLGMSTRGTAQAHCHIGLDLLPSSDSAHLRLTMRGSAVVRDAVSRRRAIGVHSSSESTISGYMDLRFTERGFELLPSSAKSRSSITILDVDARGPVIERIARRRAESMRGEAELAVARSASRRAEQQLEREAGQPLRQLNQEYLTTVRQPLVRQGAFPEARISTTAKHLTLEVQCTSTAENLANSAGSAPRLAPDVAVCVQDRYLNELMGRFLSGRTLKDEQCANLLRTLTGTTPRPLWVHDRAPRWEVTLDKAQPLQVTFRDGSSITVALVLRSVTVGDRVTEGGWRVETEYLIEPSTNGPHLVRKGPINVSNEGHVPTSGDDAEVTRFLTGKFNGVMPKELYFDGLAPPEGGSWGKLRRLKLIQCAAQDGWLAIGYELRDKPGDVPK